MIPVTIDGQIFVMDGDERIAGPFETNSAAWRWIDRREGEPISPAEKRSDFIATKILSSGPQPIMPKVSKKQRKAKQKKQRAAAKAPRWVRDIASANFDPHGNRRHRDSKLGTFGAASEVRKIDPAEYAHCSTTGYGAGT